MREHHVVLNGILYDLQRVTDIQLDSLRQSFPDSLGVYAEWITRQTGPVDESCIVPTAAVFYSSPQNWIRSPEMRRKERKNLIGTPSISGTAVIASVPPQTPAENNNSTETRASSIEAPYTSSSATVDISNFQMTQPKRALPHGNPASAQTTLPVQSVQPMKSHSPKNAELGTGALKSRSLAIMARPLTRPRTTDWDGSETENENPIQRPSYCYPVLGFPNAIYPRWIIAHSRTYTRRSSPLAACEVNNSSETRTPDFSGATASSSTCSDYSLCNLPPIPEIDGENESDGNGSIFGYPLHPCPSRVPAWVEKVSPTAFSCAANVRRSETSFIQELTTQNRMRHVFRANLPVFSQEIEESGGDSEDEDSGDEEEEESLVQGYVLVDSSMQDVTSSDRRNSGSWNERGGRGSRYPSYGSERNVLRCWNGRARRGSRCPTLVDREVEDEIENEVEVGPQQKTEEKNEEKREKRWGILGKFKEWAKKFFKM